MLALALLDIEYKSCCVLAQFSHLFQRGSSWWIVSIISCQECVILDIRFAFLLNNNNVIRFRWKHNRRSCFWSFCFSFKYSAETSVIKTGELLEQNSLSLAFCVSNLINAMRWIGESLKSDTWLLLLVWHIQHSALECALALCPREPSRWL